MRRQLIETLETQTRVEAGCESGERLEAKERGGRVMAGVAWARLRVAEAVEDSGAEGVEDVPLQTRAHQLSGWHCRCG